MTNPQPQRSEDLPTRDDSQGSRPWIGVLFTCSNEYTRVFRAPDETGYSARCRKCGRVVRFQVGSGGTDSRFFEVSC